MKAYIVQAQEAFSGASWILGVFGSLAAAREALPRLRSNDAPVAEWAEDIYYIDEWELDLVEPGYEPRRVE